MKGTLFKNGLECQIIIDGEEWNQGTEIKGTLRVTNHGDTVPLHDIGVKLALGNTKKVKTGEADAFNYEQNLNFEGDAIKKGETRELAWCFPLSENCQVTENAKSLYILFGRGDDNWDGAALQLKIIPQPTFQKFLEIIETFLRFKVKTIKSKKKGVEVKLMAPTSKEFKTVDFCNLTLSSEGKNLTLNYSFKVNKMDLMASTGHDVKMKKEEVNFDYSLGPQDYLFYGRDLDQDKILNHVNEAFEKVKSKAII